MSAWYNDGNWNGLPVNHLYTVFNEIATSCAERYEAYSRASQRTVLNPFMKSDGTTTFYLPEMNEMVGLPLGEFVRFNLPALRELILRLFSGGWFMVVPHETTEQAIEVLLNSTSFPEEWLVPLVVTDVRPWIQLREAVEGICKHHLSRWISGPSASTGLDVILEDDPPGTFFPNLDKAWEIGLAAEEGDIPVVNLTWGAIANYRSGGYVRCIFRNKIEVRLDLTAFTFGELIGWRQTFPKTVFFDPSRLKSAPLSIDLSTNGVVFSISSDDHGGCIDPLPWQTSGIELGISNEIVWQIETAPPESVPWTDPDPPSFTNMNWRFIPHGIFQVLISTPPYLFTYG